ncbi:MAG: cyclomaltodextrinase N-terminal domain-containing protein [Bacteroidales bacterium]|nr:cyclomaltodextrinase N-terminal domain-containing protein [Bacteroidales bacterium]
MLTACFHTPKESLEAVEEVSISSNGRIDRIEPPCWWTGMGMPLQVMVHGEGIGAFDVRFEGLKGVKVKEVHRADSPNYLFVDVAIKANARPGSGRLVFSREGECFSVPYEIKERPSDNDRKSFSSEDVIYLIVPDRFANGDPKNDETPDTRDVCDRSQPNARHGGDIQGIINQLDYLEDLGVTALWPTPLLEDDDPRVSYHGYACSDYYRIDPRFGDNSLYREMVSAAHEHGIKILMDIVTNHCGREHWWMQDLPFKDWVHAHEPYRNTNHVMSLAFDPNASQVDREQMEEGWFVPSMPDMNLDNPFVLKYFQQWAVWWIAWAGVDGLRVDTWYYNEKEPMAEWARAVREEFPWVNIVGEVWSLQPDEVAYWQEGHPNADGFASALPTVMDFPLLNAINRALADPEGDHGLHGTGDLRAVYDALSHDFNYADPERLLIFFSNHDTPRLADVCGADPARMKLALTLLTTLRGIPQLYYGEEWMLRIGTARRDDGRMRVDFSSPEASEDIFNYARTLLRWRKQTPVLHHGKTLHFLPQDNTYAYFRYDDQTAVMVFLNLSENAVQVPWERFQEITDGLGEGRDILSGTTVKAGQPMNAGAREALILQFTRQK